MKVQSQGWKDTLEESTATSPNILDWRIPWTEEPGGYSPQGRKEVDMTEVTEDALTQWRGGIRGQGSEEAMDLAKILSFSKYQFANIIFFKKEKNVDLIEL